MGSGIGIVIKIEDGGNRGLHPAVIGILRQPKILDDPVISALQAYGPKTALLNYRDDPVAEIVPVFQRRWGQEPRMVFATCQAIDSFSLRRLLCAATGNGLSV